VNESGAGSGEQRAAGGALDERVARALALPDALETGGAGAADRSDATDAAQKPRTTNRDGGARFLAFLGLLVGLAAAALGAWNYLHPNVAAPDLSAVQNALGTAGASLRDAQSSMSRLDQQLADMRKRVDELAAAQAAANRDIDTVRDQTMETAEMTQRLAVGDAFTSKRWMRTEAEHLMQAANIALQLNHDPATALVALEAADQRLTELADPTLMNVRAKLAEEIAALRALEHPDVEGIALTLGSLAARVELLPVAGVAKEEPAAAATTQSAWQRAVAKLGAALKSMVSVQRTSGGGLPILAPEERFFLYRNLELELESARLAALEGDAANYDQSLQSAQRWLETRFEKDNPGVQSAIAALAELQTVKLVTSWPDISGSLAELRRAEAP
jgi:uroporphyrin-3 C-methyltransferase